VSILQSAIEATEGDRRRDYDSPLINHERIAKLDCRAKDAGEPISALDVAHMMILLKIARACKIPTRDTYVDIAGYAKCGAEIAGHEI
jgi:hypothetical protein